MKYVPDNTGRFRSRPHFEPKELDIECESIITDFLIGQYGELAFPISTDALTVFLERYVEDLDLYADLSEDGADVEGVTDIIPGGKPRVRIARELSEQPWRENRLRTTLTHEFGHVHFHAPLWEVKFQNHDLFPSTANQDAPKCRREHMHDAPTVDWMEWQAGYVCGAILMPRSAVLTTVRGLAGRHASYGQIGVETPLGQELRAAVIEKFAVSHEAASTRLLKLRILTANPLPPGLL